MRRARPPRSASRRSRPPSGPACLNVPGFPGTCAGFPARTGRAGTLRAEAVIGKPRGPLCTAGRGGHRHAERAPLPLDAGGHQAFLRGSPCPAQPNRRAGAVLSIRLSWAEGNLFSRFPEDRNEKQRKTQERNAGYVSAASVPAVGGPLRTPETQPRNKNPKLPLLVST